MASLESHRFLEEGAFDGELELADASGGAAGLISVKVERLQDHEERKVSKKLEAERVQRELEVKEEEERKQVEEQRKVLMERVAKEEAERQASKQAAQAAAEAEEKAQEDARQREEDKVEVVTMCVLLLEPQGEILGRVDLPLGSTVRELARQTAHQARLPVCPQLLIGPEKLPLGPDELLLDSGVCEQGHVVWAEESAALLTASRDKTVKIWNAATGDCELTLTGHTDIVNVAHATRDLKYIVTGSNDHTAKVWAVDRIADTTTCMWTLRDHTAAVLWASFSPDGKHIATGSADRTAKIWLMKTGKCVMTCEGHGDSVCSVSFDEKGLFFITVTESRRAKVWELSSGRCEGPADDQDPAGALTVAPGGKQFCALGAELSPTTVAVCSTGTGARQLLLEGHTDEVLWASFVNLRPKRTTGVAREAKKQALAARAKLAAATDAARTGHPCDIGRCGRRCDENGREAIVTLQLWDKV